MQLFSPALTRGVPLGGMSLLASLFNPLLTVNESVVRQIGGALAGSSTDGLQCGRVYLERAL